VKSLKTSSTSPLIDLRGLVLIYLLLCILTVFFSRVFFSGLLQGNEIPWQSGLLIFLMIPAVLLLFLVLASLSLLRGSISKQIGSRFQTRLLLYFIIIVVFAAVPFAFITNISVGELVRFWKTIDVDAAMGSALDFALDAYSLRLERFERIIKDEPLFEKPIVDKPIADGGTLADSPLNDGGPPLEGLDEESLPKGIIAVQDFIVIQAAANLPADEHWESSAFTGAESLRLNTPPLMRQGFAPREKPRDTDTIRYVLAPEKNRVRVITCLLGTGFDNALSTITDERARFDIINSLRFNIQPLLLFYYAMFFLPTMLMTFIIAISFTRRIAQPLVDLAEATRRVAEGDFSIHILERRNDELGLLVHSFNTMVRDLEKSQTSLMRAEKISIWQTMAQQLAHEIKNPLTPIKLSAERVLRRWRNEPERVGEILENSMLAIIQETEGLSTLLTEFRTLSKPMEPSLSWTKVRELADETIAVYHSSHPLVEFNTEYIDANVAVTVDRRRLSQVFTNLIINAIDAMDGEGSIFMRTDVITKRESNYCRLSIRDTGKGIAAEDQSKLFTPYYTTKESGTGLGLPIIQRIVTEHGGNIWFNSELGMGATFFIDLPVSDPSFTSYSGLTKQ
jgi:nitrogen fixation/metabolism regulation signal transduction histidine kinase